MNKPLISLKIVNKDGKKVRKLTTRKIKRIYSFLKAGKNRDCIYKLSVRYGDGYKNEGDYNNKKELIYALKAFTESD
jgi:hypothetical protein